MRMKAVQNVFYILNSYNRNLYAFLLNRTFLSYLENKHRNMHTNQPQATLGRQLKQS